MRIEDDKDYFVCDHCTGIHVPSANDDGIRVLGQPAPQCCPVCNVALEHAAISGRRILYCLKCRGILVKMGVFLELVADLRARSGQTIVPRSPAKPKELRRRIHCPECQRRMHTHRYAGPGGIVIDACSKCYLDWLDYGELQRVARAPDTPPDAS